MNFLLTEQRFNELGSKIASELVKLLPSTLSAQSLKDLFSDSNFNMAMHAIYLGHLRSDLIAQLETRAESISNFPAPFKIKLPVTISILSILSETFVYRCTRLANPGFITDIIENNESILDNVENLSDDLEVGHRSKAALAVLFSMICTKVLTDAAQKQINCLYLAIELISNYVYSLDDDELSILISHENEFNDHSDDIVIIGNIDGYNHLLKLLNHVRPKLQQESWDRIMDAMSTFKNEAALDK